MALPSLSSLHHVCIKHPSLEAFFAARCPPQLLSLFSTAAPDLGLLTSFHLPALQLLRKAVTKISCSSFHLNTGVGRLDIRSDCPTSQRSDNDLRVVSRARHAFLLDVVIRQFLRTPAAHSPVSILTRICVSSRGRDTKVNVLSFWTLQFDSVLSTLVKPSISPRVPSPSVPQLARP